MDCSVKFSASADRREDPETAVGPRIFHVVPGGAALAAFVRSEARGQCANWGGWMRTRASAPRARTGAFDMSCGCLPCRNIGVGSGANWERQVAHSEVDG